MNLKEKICKFICEQAGQVIGISYPSLSGLPVWLCKAVYEYMIADKSRLPKDGNGNPMMLVLRLLDDSDLADDDIEQLVGRKYGKGKQQYCTNARNDLQYSIFFLLPQGSRPDGTILSVQTDYGPRIITEKGSEQFLFDDFYQGLMPKIDLEKGLSFEQFLNQIKNSYSHLPLNDDGVWRILKNYNRFANNDKLEVDKMEAILGLPYSGETCFKKKVLARQFKVLKTLGARLSTPATIEKFYTSLESKLEEKENGNAKNDIERLKTRISNVRMRGEIDPEQVYNIWSPIADDAEIGNSNHVAEWWYSASLEILEDILEEKDQDFNVNVSGQLVGSFDDKKRPVVALDSLTFSFDASVPINDIQVKRDRTVVDKGIDARVEYKYASVSDKKKFKLSFNTSSQETGLNLSASHDVLFLNTSEAGCFVTIANNLKRSIPFEPVKKTGVKHSSFEAKVSATNATNDEMRIYAASGFKLLDDSVVQTVEVDGEGAKSNYLSVEKYADYDTVRVDLCQGASVCFEGLYGGIKQKYRVSISVEESKNKDSIGTYYDGLVLAHVDKKSGRDFTVSFDAGTFSSLISQSHISGIIGEEANGYPIVIADDSASMTGNCWRNSIIPFTKKRFLSTDPRPSYNEWIEACTNDSARRYFKARKDFLSWLTKDSNKIFGRTTIEDLPLDRLVESQNDGENGVHLIREYVSSYVDWLKEDYNNAVITDTVWAYTGIGNDLGTRPDIIFLPPEHPLKVYWQFYAQCIMRESLSKGQYLSIVGSFSPNAIPETIAFPIINHSNARQESISFFALPTTSSYWGAYHSYEPLLEGDKLENSLFFMRWGFSVTCVKQTMSSAEVESAISATRNVCIAKDVLNVLFVSQNMSEESSRALLNTCLQSVRKDDDGSRKIGPRMISVVASKPSANSVVGWVSDGEIMQAREASDGKLRWYDKTSSATSHRLNVDVTIASLGGTQICPIRDEDVFRGVTVGGVLNYRNRKRGGRSVVITESRTSDVAAISDDTDEKLLTKLLSIFCSRDTIDSKINNRISFTADVSKVSSVTESEASHYYAFSSADIDQACFIDMPLGGDVFLWEYRLPSVKTRGLSGNGFYLLARKNETMVDAINQALLSLSESSNIDATRIDGMLVASARRGIPTIRNLSSGGKNALGEVGVYVALKLLQGNLVDSEHEGILPAYVEIDNRYSVLNILVPMDVFRNRFEEIVGEDCSHSRPDIMAFSIFVDRASDTPVQMKLSAIEVKTRSETMSVGGEDGMNEALLQYNAIRDLFQAVPKTRLEKMARLDLLVSMLSFGFRIYETLSNLPISISSLYSKVIAALFGDADFLHVSNTARLIVIHKTDRSGALIPSEDGCLAVELSKDDAFNLAVNNKRPADLNVGWLWGLAPRIQEVSNQSNGTQQIKTVTMAQKGGDNEEGAAVLATETSTGEHSYEEVIGDATSTTTICVSANNEPLNASASSTTHTVNPSVESNLSNRTTRVLLGKDLRSGDDVYWEFGHPKLNNRHFLIFGNSGMGKTYAIQAILCELGRKGQNSLIVDYTNGFLPNQLQDKTNITLRPKQNVVKQSKLPMNPFKRQSQDIGGLLIEQSNIDIAKRVTSIFETVYNLGDQQVSVLIDAVKDGLDLYHEQMSLDKIVEVLNAYLTDGRHTKSVAQSVLSKLKPFVEEAPFKADSLLSWSELFADAVNRCNVFQMVMLDKSTQRLLTEFIMWDLWAYASNGGTEKKPCIVVLDEVQNLDQRLEAPLGKYLTEGRKFGLCVMAATQTLSNLKKDEQSRLFQAAHKLFFQPAAPELQQYAAFVAEASGYGDVAYWKRMLTSLSKGECISVGPTFNALGQAKIQACKIKITSLEDRGI